MKFVLLKVVNSNGAIVSNLIEAEDYEGSCKKSSNCFPFLEFCSENTADNYKEVIYIGRQAAASPATGYLKKHLAQQKEIIEKVLSYVCRIKF